jgi:hypothetical protein
MRSWPFLLALAVGCSSCSKAEAPKITPEAVRVLTISPAGAQLETTLDAYNPNDEDLSASSMTTTVSVGGKPEVARATVSTPLDLPAKQRLRVTVPITVEWVDTETLKAFAAANQEAPYSVDGSVEFQGKRGKVQAPFHVAGTMSPAELRQATTAAPPTPPPTASASASVKAPGPKPPR